MSHFVMFLHEGQHFLGYKKKRKTLDQALVFGSELMAVTHGEKLLRKWGWEQDYSIMSVSLTLGQIT